MYIIKSPQNFCTTHQEPFWKCPVCGNRGCNRGRNEQKCSNHAFTEGICLRCHTHVASGKPSMQNHGTGVLQNTCPTHKRAFWKCPNCGNTGCNNGKMEQACAHKAFEEGLCLQCRVFVPSFREK